MAFGWWVNSSLATTDFFFFVRYCLKKLTILLCQPLTAGITDMYHHAWLATDSELLKLKEKGNLDMVMDIYYRIPALRGRGRKIMSLRPAWATK
jgi:hypothetical protein